MDRIIELNSLSEPGAEVYARLTEAQLRSWRSPEKGIFIAESSRVIGYALDAGCEPVSLLMDHRHIEGPGREIIARCGDIPVYTGEDALLEQLTGYALTRSVLCAMRRPAPRTPEEVCAGTSRIAVLEGIADTTNLGAIFRSAAALGMEAVLLSPDCADPLNRRAARVSMGTVFQVPWARLEEKTENWPGAGMERLHGMGFATAALALTDRSVSITDYALKEEPMLALLLGTEGTGLRQETIDSCTYTVKIPMHRGVDSLNVAAAAAVAFWEMGRTE